MTQALYDLCLLVTSKRPRRVIDHILRYGQITTEELKTKYGYDHPPRAVCDVRENGIPLNTSRVRSKSTGRMIAAYRFGDPAKAQAGRIGGRSAFSKKFKQALLDSLGSRCSITGEKMESRYLQIDHRVPYAIAGESNSANPDPTEFMLLDASSQRAKSWSCEQCDNFKKLKKEATCRKCFWAFPENYEHVAMKPERRLVLVWSGKDELADFQEAARAASDTGVSLQTLLKNLVAGLKKD